MTDLTQERQTFIVTQDDELVPELSVLPPTPLEAAVECIQGRLHGFVGNIALQTRMAVYDARFGTNYRTIRNNLVHQKRNEEFEKSIGLIAINAKKK